MALIKIRFFLSAFKLWVISIVHLASLDLSPAFSFQNADPGPSLERIGKFRAKGKGYLYIGGCLIYGIIIVHAL